MFNNLYKILLLHQSAQGKQKKKVNKLLKKNNKLNFEWGWKLLYSVSRCFVAVYFCFYFKEEEEEKSTTSTCQTGAQTTQLST
jgi:hypothetical protein